MQAVSRGGASHPLDGLHLGTAGAAPHEIRTVEITLRLTPTEHRQVKSLAETAGMPLARYCRERALNRVQSRADQTALIQLVRVGNNLNQVARSLNTNPGKVVQGLADEVREVLAKVTDVAAVLRGRDDN